MEQQLLLDLLDRTARIEENQKHLMSQVSDLPQSKQCAEDIKALKEEVSMLQQFKDEVNRKVAYVGGVLITLGMAIPYAINWIAAHLHWRSP
jgi:uncharacterized protein (UPF0335 family)